MSKTAFQLFNLCEPNSVLVGTQCDRVRKVEIVVQILHIALMMMPIKSWTSSILEGFSVG